ncbi:MAG: phospho-N-acetylmuramoyl-pentapeptide-transferase [Rickettsiales bacterium]|nr:MAG: phospho-N-acetylmuramoyl-pentapeptide-transferase [Rickettsiales bacterium]
MLYNILASYAGTCDIANLFAYISSRSILATLLSASICFMIAPSLISYLRKVQKHGQPIRKDGPETHFSKAGTPTMGGVMVLFSATISTLLLADLYNPYIWVCLFVMLSFGALGFMDDYTKLSRNNHHGVSGRVKLAIQMIVSMIAFIVVQRYTEPEYATQLTFPFFKSLFLDLGYFYLPFAMFVIVGSSNAMNLTDGLDGLAIGTGAIAISSFALISYLVGSSVYAESLQIIHIPEAGELAVLCGAIIGSSIGFLWYNSYPAQIFMGDTGSLALGGFLGIISVITKHELALSIIGGVLVIETLSVIIQVYYFKMSGGKRVFLMAPLHHHFEKKGWPESKVVIRFWILALICALVGLSSLKLG